MVSKFRRMLGIRTGGGERACQRKRAGVSNVFKRLAPHRGHVSNFRGLPAAGGSRGVPTLSGRCRSVIPAAELQRYPTSDELLPDTLSLRTYQTTCRKRTTYWGFR